MSNTDPYKSPETSVEATSERLASQEQTEQSLVGLRGWLILVGFGIVLSPFRMVFQIYPLYTEILSNGAWELLATPGSDEYNPAFAPFIIAEMVINVLLVFCWLYIAYLFFSKKRAFPKWYIAVMAFTLVFIIADALYLVAFFPGMTLNDPETIKEIIQMIVGAAIWIPYMLVSKRVKATFVR